MSREVEYRRYAAVLLDLAKRAADAADKFRLLAIADAWLKLAKKATGLPSRDARLDQKEDRRPPAS